MVLARLSNYAGVSPAFAHTLGAAVAQHACPAHWKKLSLSKHARSFFCASQGASGATSTSLTGLITTHSKQASPLALFQALRARFTSNANPNTLSGRAAPPCAFSSTRACHPAAAAGAVAAPFRHLTTAACSTAACSAGCISSVGNSLAVRSMSRSSRSGSCGAAVAGLWRRLSGNAASVSSSGGHSGAYTAAATAGAAGAAGAAARGGSRTVVSGAGFTLPTALTSSEALAAGVPAHLRRQLVWWVGGTAAWVYTMVVLGGVTRLTRSGLSMTDWKLTGERPPLTEEHWQEEFGKYRESPEFKKLHPNMTLEDFKFIFWMEYAHRMWGRLLGIAFVVPAAYFAARGAINRALAKRLGLLFTMGGTQGLVGWWMVRSGLDEPQEEWQAPRVSPYRLAAHLVSAFTIFATLAWTTMDLSMPTPAVRNMGQVASAATALVRRAFLPFAALVAVTATSGAFVAGMDAGRAYNTFPLMAGRWVPEEYWELWDRGYGFRNFFENTAAVQFDHRMLAGVTACAVGGLWAFMRFSVQAAAIPHRAKLAMDLVAAITVAQISLGIWTLLEIVPPHLGSAHQANALNLFTAVLWTLHALRPSMLGPRAASLSPFVTPVAAAGVVGIGLAVTTNK